MVFKLKKKKSIWIAIVVVIILLFAYSAVSKDDPSTPSTLSSSPTTSQKAPDSSLSAGVSQDVSPEKSEMAQSSDTTTPIQSPVNVVATGSLKVHFIDVGQADSEFIELPNGQTMLIDAGNPDDGDNIISYIEGLGYKSIDYLVASHPHADHIGGMAAVVNEMGIKSIYMPKVSNNTQTFEELLDAINAKGLSVKTARGGVSLLDTADLKVYMIAPIWDSYEDLNNYSAVIKIVYKNNSFLFMGDAEEISENLITADVSATVLKVGHHGSNSSTSQAFLDKVAPNYAVISVGADNEYGHPSQVILDKLMSIGTAVYRTDKDGTIVFTSDGAKITVIETQTQAISITLPVPSTEPQVVTTVEPLPSAPTQDDDQSVSVYITNTGSKYHRGNCRYLKSSKIEITLADAKAGGYDPCSVCNPPS